MEKDKGDENSLWHSYQIIHFLKSIGELLVCVLNLSDIDLMITLVTKSGKPVPGTVQCLVSKLNWHGGHWHCPYCGGQRPVPAGSRGQDQSQRPAGRDYQAHRLGLYFSSFYDYWYYHKWNSSKELFEACKVHVKMTLKSSCCCLHDLFCSSRVIWRQVMQKFILMMLLKLRWERTDENILKTNNTNLIISFRFYAFM